MPIKKIILAFILAISLYSAETNAEIVNANQCTLALLPIGTTFREDTKKNEIISAYEKKGYYVTVVTDYNERKNYEFISDTSLVCIPTFFGVISKTSVRLLNATTNRALYQGYASSIFEDGTCHINLFAAIAELPDCQIK